jgi:integrase
MCSGCESFLSNRYFSAHRCPSTLKKKTVLTTTYSSDRGKEFSEKVLPFFRGEKANDIITDDTITSLGLHDYTMMSETNKYDESRRRTMSYMRSLLNLSIQFKIEGSKVDKNLITSDMFIRSHIIELEDAVNKLTSNVDGCERYGMKLKYGFVIKTSAETLKSLYLIKENDDRADEVAKFQTCFQSRWKSRFGKAEKSLKNRSIECLRMPCNLPKDSDLVDLRRFISDKLLELDTKNRLCEGDFVQIRRLCASRLVQFCGRRVNEVGRLSFTHLQDAFDEKWINDKNRAEARSSYIAYVPAKNSIKPVAVIIPKDPILVRHLQWLMSDSARRREGVPCENKFVFPSTKGSMFHVSAYHDFSHVCDQAGLKGKITSTGNRHFLATEFQAEGPSTRDQELFVGHLGHSVYIDKNIYQVPESTETINVVGKFLKKMDCKKSSEYLWTRYVVDCHKWNDE